MTSSSTQRKNNAATDLLAIYSPRTAYDKIRQEDEQLLSDLTLNFDPFTINILKSEFAVRKGEMKIVEFVMILKEHLLDWQIDIPHRDRKLTRCLALLYDEIDLNGNGILEWDEFTNYVIEKATVINNIKNKNEEIKSYSASMTKLQKKFNALLAKSVYISDIDKVAVFEEGSDEVSFINHETGSITIKPLKVSSKNDNEEETKQRAKVDGKPNRVQTIPERARILDMLYIEDKKYNVLVTSSDDCFVRCWRYSSNGFVNASPEVGSMVFKEAQICLAWDSINEVMYTGQRDGVVNIWDKKSDTIIGIFDAKEGHNSVIMDMIPMPKLQLLATCSLDHKIILWDTIVKKKQKVYEEHSRGVVSLAFNESLILLISAGLDHKILIWNPYIQKSIFQITSHSFPIVRLTMIEKQSHFVSLDSSGAVRVWDIKKFKCIQSFSVETTDEKHKFHPQALTFIPKPLKLIIAGRTVQFFHYDKNYNPVSVDDSPAIGAYYRPETLSIITPAGTKIKVWNALNGEVKKIFSDIHQHDITSFALDEFKKRCLIGFSNGEAAVYNVINGAKIKNLAKHNGEVGFILEARNLEYIITASSVDNTIKLNTDGDINDSENLRNIIINEAQISALVYEATNKMLIIGTQNGIVGFYEAETGKFIGQCSVQQDSSQNEEISGVVCLTSLPYIIAATSAGRMIVVARPPSPFKYAQVFTFVNHDVDKPNLLPFIHSIIWCHKTRRLFIDDEKSMIKAYNLSPLIEILEKDYNMKRASENSTNKYDKNSLTPPQVPNIQLEPIWVTKAHNEAVMGLEYVVEEDILITSGMDKRVRIFHASTGKFIDSLQQNYNKSDPSPIAYKKSGTSEIYTADMKDRVDKEHIAKLKKEWEILTKLEQEKSGGDKKDALLTTSFTLQAVEKLLKAKEKEKSEIKPENVASKFAGMLLNKKSSTSALAAAISNRSRGEQQGSEREKESKSGLALNLQQQMGQNKRAASIYQRTLEEEFDPFHDYSNIDLGQLKQANSTPWKLRPKFENVMKVFDEYINTLEDQVRAEEKRLTEVHTKKSRGDDNIGSETIVPSSATIVPASATITTGAGEGSTTGAGAGTVAVGATNTNTSGTTTASNAVKHFRVSALAEQANKIQPMVQKSEAQMLLDQEQENLKRIKEAEKAKLENFRKILHQNDKKQLQKIEKGDSPSPEVIKIIENRKTGEMHRKVLKGKMLDRNKPIVRLSQEEADAAYRLAAALSNYDKDELKNLNFINIEVKSDKTKSSKNDKNFIQANKKQLTGLLGEESDKGSPTSSSRKRATSKR